MSLKKLIVASLFATALSSAPVIADDSKDGGSQGILPVPQYGPDLTENMYLSGDWGGVRQDWANSGAQFNVDWVQSLQKITSGGLQRDTGYANTIDYNLSLDLMRMGILPGALVTFRGESRFGDTINSKSGSILPANTDAFFPLTNDPEDEVPFTITALSYTQFLSQQFGITLGKFDTLDGDPNEFASGRGRSQFMDANFVFNSATALRMPYSTLGGGLIWMPVPASASGAVTAKSLLFTTTDSSESSGFGDFSDGLSWITEVDTQYRLAGLPGGQNVGFLYAFDQDFRESEGQLILQPGERPQKSADRSTWSVFWSGWQYLVVCDPSEAPIDLGNGIADRQGFGLFARAGFADHQTNPVSASFSGGLGGRGVFSRANDSYGFGYYYTDLQTNLLGDVVGISDSAQGFEANYIFAITPAVQLTVDLQLVDSILPETDNGFVVGGRLRVVL